MENSKKKFIFRSGKETSTLIAAGKRAGSKAIRENKALGLGSIQTKQNQIIKQNNDGTFEIIVTVQTPLKSTLQIKKGSILYAKST